MFPNSWAILCVSWIPLSLKDPISLIAWRGSLSYSCSCRLFILIAFHYYHSFSLVMLRAVIAGRTYPWTKQNKTKFLEKHKWFSIYYVAAVENNRLMYNNIIHYNIYRIIILMCNRKREMAFLFSGSSVAFSKVLLNILVHIIWIA